MDKGEDAVDKKADETVDVLEKHGGEIDASIFCSEHSEWVEIITNIVAGTWG